ncbi:DUF4105 domain-containing protein [Flavobacterium sp.]|uniref:lipoprotein N-acyltransferase Lnb domain-containing protein n=1 Tax=Flavobacterium sp. TaxID=239 RepID=UPI002629D717|nr:DUF4105 domain-containing protein [Flavobacterium sp.]
MLKKITFFLCLVYFNSSFSQQSPITENTKVSILTVDVADESHTLYGHTALRIQDPTTNIDLIYNYGMFDFRTENFILKFVKGDMQYYAAAYPYADFEYSYQLENRSVYEQVLNISLAEKQTLFEKLSISMYSADRFYTYKFIDRNCTTKVIDIVNEVLQNKPIKNTLHQKESYREVLYPYAKNHFYMQLGINIIFGARVDNKAETLFLPLDLMEVLNNTSYQNKPLVSKTTTNFKANRTTSFSFLDSVYSLLIVLLFFVILNKKTTNIFYFSVLGLVGLLFSAIGLYSFHRELLWNYNVLLFNPLFLFLVFFIIRNNTKWVKKISWICLAFLGVYTLYMVTKIHLLIVLPIVIATSILLLRLALKKTN